MDCPIGAKLIPLTQGKFAIVDEEKYESLRQYNWYANKNSQSPDIWYAARKETVNGKRRTIFMHRQILGLAPGTDADHININGLDNRCVNLRSTDRTLNLGNTRKSKNNQSGFKGVSWYPSLKKWRATIQSYRHYYFLGYFHTAEEAAKAYDQKARELFGEFARTNFPRDNRV